MRTLLKEELKLLDEELVCDQCGEPIKNGKEAYILSKVVCDWCFHRLRKNGNKGAISSFYDKFVKRKLI
jgi:hypothetical protein